MLEAKAHDLMLEAKAHDLMLEAKVASQPLSTVVG
jgi:hypothetical protein